MLVLSRKRGESVLAGGFTGPGQVLKVTVVDILNGRVRLGFEAAADVYVHRWEVWESIRSDGIRAGSADEDEVPADR